MIHAYCFFFFFQSTKHYFSLRIHLITLVFDFNLNLHFIIVSVRNLIDVQNKTTKKTESR